MYYRDALEKQWITDQPIIETAAYVVFKRDHAEL